FTLYNIAASSSGLLGGVFPKILFQIIICFWYLVYSLVCMVLYHPDINSRNGRLTPFEAHRLIAISQGVLLIVLIVVIFGM
ncbi:hypothetical protein, partial [Providencia heimbachae]